MEWRADCLSGRARLTAGRVVHLAVGDHHNPGEALARHIRHRTIEGREQFRAVAARSGLRLSGPDDAQVEISLAGESVLQRRQRRLGGALAIAHALACRLVDDNYRDVALWRALLFDDRVRAILPPSSGRTALLQLIARVERQSLSPITGATDLARGLTETGRLIRRPSLVIVITDFMSDHGWQRPLTTLAMRHEVVAAWITDPREGDIPDIGVITFEDPESGQQILVDTRDARLRARFQDAAEEQREAIRADLLRARVGVAELSTAAELVPQLIAFIKQREALRGRRLAPASA